MFEYFALSVVERKEKAAFDGVPPSAQRRRSSTVNGW